jgi:hypothetical protein
MGVPGGKLLKFTTNVADAAVMLPEPSRVRSKVTVALPAPVDSAFVIAGTSFDASNKADSVGLGSVEGDEGESLHAETTTASATIERTERFIVAGSLDYSGSFQQGRDQPCRLAKSSEQ